MAHISPCWTQGLLLYCFQSSGDGDNGGDGEEEEDSADHMTAR